MFWALSSANRESFARFSDSLGRASEMGGVTPHCISAAMMAVEIPEEVMMQDQEKSLSLQKLMVAGETDAQLSDFKAAGESVGGW